MPNINDILLRTFSGDSNIGWVSGRIDFISLSDNDQPHFVGFPLRRVSVIEPIDWMLGLIAALDAELPPEAVIANCVSADAFVIGEMPAAFRIPSKPHFSDAAHCLLAARVLSRCINEVLPPHGASSGEFQLWLQQISCMALLLGGEAAALAAFSMNADPNTYRVRGSHSVAEV